MKSSVWMKLLRTRTSAEALETVQEARRMSEVWGMDNAVKHIWRTFEKAYATDHYPTQDILNELIHGPEIPHADATAMRRFMNRCQAALTTMEYDDTVKVTLNSSQHQDAIARRLGDTVFQEWSSRRHHLKAKQKTVTFSTFCDWLQVKTRVLSDCEEQHLKSAVTRIHPAPGVRQSTDCIPADTAPIPAEPGEGAK